MKKIKLLLTMAVIVFTTMICCSMSAFALTEGDWEFQLSNICGKSITLETFSLTEQQIPIC